MKKILKNKQLKFIIKKRLNQNDRKDVLRINNENMFYNGGQLHYKGILSYDYCALASFNNSIIAYVLLKKSYILKNDIYTMQVAVDLNYHHKQIGTTLYNYIYKHLKDFKFFTANVRPQNKASIMFHEKMGFIHKGENEDGFTYIKEVNNAKLSLNKTKPIYKPLN